MGSTANLVLPYPEDTDPLANMAAAVQALAEALDSSLNGVPTDSGWVNVTSTLGAGTIQYRRRGKWVTVWVGATAVTASGTTYTIGAVGALPAAVRPGKNSRGANDFSGFPGTLLVRPDGAVLIAQNSGANRAAIEGCVVFPVEAP